MAEEKTNKRLGRGLAALIGEMDKPVVQSTAEEVFPEIVEPLASDGVVPIESVYANPNNPRRDFKPEELQDLANSIAEHGIVQPILVRSGSDGRWEIIAGERRWRAAQKAGLHDVPIVVREVDDRQALELAIIENVQRADLNPVEEALGYQQLIDEHDYKQADLGKVIGKSRSHVANTLRLLKLPESVRQMLTSGALSPGHARTLVTLDNPDSVAKRIVAEGLSVRQAEALANSGADASTSKKHSRSVNEKDADTRALEKRLGDALGMAVSVDNKARGGRVVVKYKSLEQLDDIIARLESTPS